MTENFWKIIEKYKIVIFFLIISVFSLYVRMNMLDMVTHDYNGFLKPWFDALKANGGFQALNLDIGNYNAPYITILAFLTYLPFDSLLSIKVVSIIFDYVCAIAVVQIIRTIIKDQKKKEFLSVLIYGIVLFLPTVLLNSAWWGQCDSIYVAFILISIVCLLNEKYFKAFVFLGISFAFKLQFIFILPLYILIYISKRKFPLYYFGIIPIVNFIMCIPSMLFGKSLQSCIDVYFNQTSDYNAYLSLNFPGVYNLFFSNNDYFVYSPNLIVNKIGILVTIFVFILIAFAVLYYKVEFNKQSIIEFGLWSIMIATFLLPQMHERYLYAGDILSIAYFMYNKDKLYVPVGISALSMYCYSKYLFGASGIPLQYATVFYLVIIVLVTKDICKKYFVQAKETIEKVNYVQ